MINLFPILLLFPEYLFTLRETPFEETDSKKYKVNLSIIPSPRNLSKKEKPYNFHISPNSIPITIHDSCPLSFENIFHQSQRNFQTRKPIPGHEEAKSRLTGALDGAHARPRNAKSLSLSPEGEQSLRERPAGTRKRERSRASFADTVVRHLPGGLFALSLSRRGYREPYYRDGRLFPWPWRGEESPVYSPGGEQREREEEERKERRATSKRKRVEEAGCSLLAAVTC